MSAILRFCHENHIKVVPRGAGTSLSGGALPLEDAIVLCLTRMNKVLSLDLVNRVARVEAGITNTAITEAVAGDGFFYAPDPSSQIACTVGGNVATNSGGAHCLKYGVTTNNVLGVRIVLMNGEMLDIGGPSLDAPGYDFLALIVGLRRPVRRRHRGHRAPAQGGRRRAPDAARLRLQRDRAAPASPPSSPPASSPWRSSSWTAPPSMSASISSAPAIRSTSRRC